MNLAKRPLPTLAFLLGAVLSLACGSRGSEHPDDIKAGTGVGGGGGGGCVKPEPANLPDAPAFKIVGYAPSWAASSAAIQYDKLDFIAYAFAIPDRTGGVRGIDNASKLKEIVERAHKEGSRVLIAVGGWNNGDDSAFEEIVLKEELRVKFADSLMSLVDCFGLDGIDLDWEYPEAEDQANFGLLVRELSSRLRPQGKFLTAAVAADQWNSFGFAEEDLKYFDFLNIMAYDGGGPEGHSSMDYAREGLQRWQGQGLTKQQSILGVPFYGRSQGGSGQGLIAYKDILAAEADAPNRDSVTIDNVTYWYNGFQTMKDKVALAKAEAGGIMIWDLSQDVRGDDSLLSTIHEAAR